MTLKPLQCYTIICTGVDVPISDIIAPGTQLLETPADPSATAVQRFRFDGSDNASPTVTFQCSVDEAAWGPCSSPAALDLPVGSHTIAVRAVDAAGNVDLTPAGYEWWVNPPEAAPADVSVTSAPDATTVQTDATFEFAAATAGATFQCKLDTADFVPCASPKEYPGPMAVGTHTFTVRASSSTGEATATYIWRVRRPPVAREVVCGEVLLESVKVMNDLLDCPDNALVIGTGSITLDLNGHTIDGKGLGGGVTNMGFDNVTITNGSIHEFDYGVLLNPGSGSNIVRDLRLELNQEAGIGLADADENGKGNTIEQNTIVSNGYGIALFSGTKNAIIRNNELGLSAKGGVYLEHATAARLEKNEIVTPSGPAVFSIGGSDHVIVGNSLTENLGGGINIGEELLPTHRVHIEDNSIIEGAGGIMIIESSSAAVIHNQVRDVLGNGVLLDMAHDNVVRANDLRGSAGGIELSESYANRIEGNNASGTLGSGIEVGDSAPVGQGNWLEGNNADSNGGDGISLEGAGHIVKDNSARINGGWGIYAAIGAVDRGGNFAAGNMEFDQCYKVLCATGALPGEPETWIVDHPAEVSNSRNASFTYMGKDDITPIFELVFECRVDSTDSLAWEDCEYPAEILNLSPGIHTFEVRAIDLKGAGLADSTPAKFTWKYEPLAAGVAPLAFIDVKPPAQTWLPD